MSNESLAARVARRGFAWPVNTFLVLPQHRLLYLPIAKNACSSLKKLVLSLSGRVDPAEMQDIGDVHKFITQSKLGLKLSDYPADTAAGMLADSSYSKFCVLRDPRRRQAYDERLESGEGVRIQIAEATAAAERKAIEDEGRTPQGRQFFKVALSDLQRKDWTAASRNLQTALTFEPENETFKERLALVREKLRS